MSNELPEGEWCETCLGSGKAAVGPWGYALQK